VTWTEDVDVSTSARLAAALEAVRREPGGWESALGAAVDAAVVAAVPERVGAGRISYLVERGFWSGRAEVVSELVGVVRELVMMRPVLLEVGPARLWPALVRRAVWQVAAEAEGDRQHGLAGDSQPFRLRVRADRAGISFLQVDASVLDRSEAACAIESVDLDRSGWRVAVEDVAGSLLGCLVSILTDFGVPRGVALAGTRRVLEIAVGPGKRRERHSMARGDAGEGVLASLGVSPAAAGAWMSLIAGSHRPDTLAQVKAALQHPRFDLGNPNKARALIGAFTRNVPHFHATDGSGYAFVAEKIRLIDAFNPQSASGLCRAFNLTPDVEPHRRALIQRELFQLAALDNLSKDVREIIEKILGQVGK